MARTPLEATQADVDAVTRIAHEYIESYARGDAERHAKLTSRKHRAPDGQPQLAVGDYAGVIGGANASAGSDRVSEYPIQPTEMASGTW